MDRPIDCRFYRRFGVEIELNTLSGVIKRPNADEGEIPEGADYVACLVRKASGGSVEIAAWDYVHNNDKWVLKHDMSCGLEINTPVFKGWSGLESLLRVVEALSKDKLIKANELCSLHVHVGIGDLTVEQVASVIAHYIKCEHVFMDSVPAHRKNNRYCHPIGLTDWFDTDFDMDPMEIISKISQSKYGSINTFHFMRGGGFGDNDRRQTIEFRIAENAACVDPYYVKNWIRLLLHFVEVTKDLPVPLSYTEGDPTTGLVWYSLSDVYRLMKFDQQISDGMLQVRQWFLDRIRKNGFGSNLPGIWSNAGRIANRFQLAELNIPRIDDAEDGLYGKRWII